MHSAIEVVKAKTILRERTSIIHRGVECCLMLLIAVELSDDIYKWLNPVDSTLLYHRLLDMRHPGTCMWFLEGVEYTRWKANGGKGLWLSANSMSEV